VSAPRSPETPSAAQRTGRLRRLTLVALVVASAVVGAGATTVGGVGTTAAGDASLSTPRFVSLVPNPVATDDRGERLTVALPEARPAGPITLSDGETVVRVPWRSGGRVVLTPDPGAVDPPVSTGDATGSTGRVVEAPGLSLSNAGERLDLRVGNRTVDVFRYRDAPEGERLVRSPAGGGTAPVERVPVGLDPRPVAATGSGRVTAFVLPDAAGVPVATLRGADRRILLAGYTFASERVARLLVAAVRRGVEVRVLVEGAPVGGATARQAALLDRLAAAGVDVRAIGGPRARVDFHHAKYAVVDDRALVLTENWKPAGTGGRDSRGWGVRVESARFADELAAVYAHDADWRDAVPWRRFRAGRSFRDEPAANGSFAGDRDPARVRADAVRLLTAPGNAGDALAAEIDGAERRVAVLQPTLGGPDQRLVRATIRAARRGVDVRILLSRAWYVREDNRALARRLNARADREGLSLSVRLARGDDRFGKVHAKGLVVDDTVVVGSVNWNDHSIEENREVAVALDGPPADYFRGAFDADWRRASRPGGREGPPLPLLGAAAVAVLGAVAVARRTIGWADGDGRRFEEWRS